LKYKLVEKFLKYISKSQTDTINLGKRLGSHLSGGDVIALTGELGSGKTWLTKGIAQGLGVDTNTVVTSPSFALVNVYEGRNYLYHMDFYRLQGSDEVIGAGLDEYIYQDGVTVIEWADRWPEILPEQSVSVNFAIIDDQQREIVLYGNHSRAVEILESIEEGVNID
jgi:tRNA threonylcarbamoyladenosine biosynthesis protein TsaE